MLSKIPKFSLIKDGHDISTQVRIVCVANGFLVRTGGSPPVHYSSIAAVIRGISAGLKQLDWPTTENNSTVKITNSKQQRKKNESKK